VARPPSHRRRFLAGLAAALAVGVGGTAFLLGRTHEQIGRDAAERRGVVSLLALGEVLGRAGGRGERVREVVRAWQARQPEGVWARVLVIEGLSLEASSAPGDRGERAAPRRLVREEKPLFDAAQRIRGAVESNRQGGAPKPEIEIEPVAGGARALAAPLEVGGEVVGMLQVASPPGPRRAPPGPLGPILAFAAPLLAFWLAARRIGERRWALAAAAAVALAAGMAAFGAGAVRSLASASSDAQAAVADHVRKEAAEAAALAVRLGLPAGAPLEPGRWDADEQRRPRGRLAADGTPDAARTAAEVGALRGDATGALASAFLVALAALALVGLGGLARIGRELVTHRQAYAYVAPAMIGTTVLVFFPFLYGIALSFTDSNIYNTAAPLWDIWIGFRNYASILGDLGIARRGADGSLVFNYLNFYWTFLFTVVWTVTNVSFGVSFGLLLALVLNTKDLALRPVYRVLLILPWAMPNYITALIWKGMFHRQFGVVNQALALVGLQPISWFDTPFTSYLTALATNGWLSFPFMMVVSLGALQSIPADIYEAARVDGATRWQQFRAITLPSLRPALVPAVILSVIWTFNMFNIIYLVTGGQPNNATEILITQAYKYAFERYRYGYAAAYSTVIFAILLVYGVLQNRVTRATEAL
jgi:arabinogalactan oligomer/maltooligosaccharide transport system permease protein